ncbi:hypothetical protein ACLKA6_003425 [Drosophila palustris]
MSQHLRQYDYKSSSAPVDKDVLCIVIDFDANQCYLRRDSELFTKVVSYLIVLANAHLLQRTANNVAILGYSSRSVNYIYPEESYGTVFFDDSQMEQFATVEHLTKLRLSELMFEEMKEIQGESNARYNRQSSSSLLSGTISMALTYVNRCRREASKSMQINARILVVSGSMESRVFSTNRHMSVFPVAAKMGVAVDVCALEVDTSYMLRQAAEITSGFYFGTSDFDALGMNLLCLFLMPPQGRHHLNYPKQPPTDLRAICSCHNKFIEIGFACSSCLSIFCKYTPVCTTCDTVFKPPHKLQLYIDRKSADQARRHLARAKRMEQMEHMI